MSALCGRDSATAIRRVTTSAYPRVISNLGSLGDQDDTRVALNMIRFMNHFARSIYERQRIIDFFRQDTYVPAAFLDPGAGRVLSDPKYDLFHQNPKNPGTMGTRPMLGMMYDYFATGIATTLGYAHANSGDTMTSVLIGGLCTVMNGDFELFAGDPVQFYWYGHLFFSLCVFFVCVCVPCLILCVCEQVL